MANNYNTFIARDTLYKPTISSTMQKNHNNLEAYIAKYIDYNHDVLFSNFTYSLIWRYDISYPPSEADEVYKATGVAEDQWIKAIDDSHQLKASWIHFRKPYWWALVSIIKYYVDTNNRKGLEFALLFFSCSMYATIHYKYYRGFPINPAIADYTVSTLSNRYDIKRLGSLFKALHKIALTNHETYVEYFDDKKFCDRYIIEYMQNLFTRINNFVKEIKIVFQKNKDSRKYMNYEEESSDPEDYREIDNQSMQVSRLVNKIIGRIISNGLNINAVMLASKLTTVSINLIKDVITNIVVNNIEEVREFITIFLQQYLIVDAHPIESMSSSSYITYCNKIYGKVNTNDKGIIRLKDMLHDWLSKYSSKYMETTRTATLINYRKAIFLYFTTICQAVVNNKY